MCGVTNSNGPIMHILTIFYPFDNNSTLSKHLQTALCDNISTIFDYHFTTLHHSMIIFAFEINLFLHKPDSKLQQS